MDPRFTRTIALQSLLGYNIFSKELRKEVIMSSRYVETLKQIQDLTTQDQLRLLEALAALVRRQMSQSPQHDIMELQGLGKEIWEDIDAQAYVDQERASWDG
jgi:hypothetical protein